MTEDARFSSPNDPPTSPQRAQPPGATLRQQRRLVVLGTLVALLVVLGAVPVILWTSSPSSEVSEASSSPTSVTPQQRAAPPTTAHSGEPVAVSITEPVPVFVETPIADDGKTLWASPTAGSPLALGYLPAGVQALLVVRPAALQSHPEGERALAALGPWGERTWEQFLRAVGCDRAEISLAVAACAVDDQNELSANYRIELDPPWTEDEIARRHPDAQRSERQGKTAWTIGERAFFLPEEFGGRMLVACPIAVVDELLASCGTPLPMAPTIELLASWTDVERSFSLLASSDFLAASGAQLFSGSGRLLYDGWSRFLGRDATAFLFSAHWGKDFFVELRVTTRPDVPPQRFSQQLRQRLAMASNELQQAVLAESWTPYSRQTVGRLPLMVQTLGTLTRAAVDERQAVLRVYLPLAAGHNLALGSELFLNQRDVQSMPIATNEPDDPASSDKESTLVERLRRPATLVFTKETLEHALELIAEELAAPIDIRGDDLRLEGITKNQSFAVELRQLPLEEILVTVLLKANPDRTASGPSDPRQKLVYVVKPALGDKEGGVQTIVVTTRSAAALRGDSLPAVFSESTE